MARLIVVGDTHCRYDLLDAMIARELAADAGTSAVLHVGDLGLYDGGSLGRLSVRERGLIEKHRNPLHLAHAFLEGHARLGLPLVGIAGNHEDFFLVERLERKENDLPGLTLLAPGEVVDVPLGERRLRVMGLGRIVAQADTSHPRRAKYIQPEHLERAATAGEAQPPDVLLLHDPPALMLEGGRAPFGSQPLTDLIARVRPGIVLCGHMHFEYATEVHGVPVRGLGYGAMGRYGVIGEDLRFEFRDRQGRPAAQRAVEPAPPPAPRAVRGDGHLQRAPLPVTAHGIVERFGLGRLDRRQRRALDGFLADLRRAFVAAGGMDEAEAWARAEGFVRGAGLGGDR
jgi:hypothetical protein